MKRNTWTRLFTLITFFSFIFPLKAQNLNIVAVGEAETARMTLIFGRQEKVLSDQKNQKIVEDFNKVIINDLNFYQRLWQISEKEISTSFLSGSIDWNGVNGDYLVTSSWRDDVSLLRGKMTLYKIKDKSVKDEFEIKLIKSTFSRKDAHDISNQIYKAITEKDGIFNSKIYFVSDRESRGKSIIKELYSMDYDGFNKKQLTFHRGTVISPALSQDGKLVLYSLIKNNKRRKNVTLRLLNLETGADRLLSNRSGINSGAVFMADNNRIVLTLSHQGNAELYIMDIRSNALTRLTKHHAPDVDPSVKEGGDMLTFLSGRPGTPMIYTMKPNGLESEVKRISYVGQFNATPRFSPDGREIAFSSWMDNRFDIFKIRPNGTGLARLTKDFGSNEDPTYSPDGQFLAFSSQRVISRTQATQNVYIMNNDGEILGAITKNYGNCITPRWVK